MVMLKRIIILIFILSVVFSAKSQNIVLRGGVTDSITGEGLPYVSIIFKGTTIGTATDGNGMFSFTSSTKSKYLEISYLGYDTKTIRVIPGKMSNMHVKLVPSGIALNEVIVKPKRDKYSKKENPAVTFIKEVIDRRGEFDPLKHDYFQYEHYEKMTFAMNDYQPKVRSDGKHGKFDFMADFVDTLDNHKTILPISEKEKLEMVYYRKSPKSEKRIVSGDRSAGVDEIFSRDGIKQLLDQVFREVNIFQNDIPLFLMRFVSPISTIGPNYYKYYLLDTVQVNGTKCLDMGFVPFNAETFGFTGHLYVTLDSTYFIQKVLLNVPKNINLNFVYGMTIEQTFNRTSDGTRVINKDDITVDFKLSEKSKGMYARRLSIYSKQSFDPPTGDLANVFDKSAPVISMKQAYHRTEDFWKSTRPKEAAKRNPNTVEQLMAKFRSVPLFYVTEKVVSILVSGYIPTSTDKTRSKFEFGPANTTVSYNALEGARFRVGGTTTTAFSKNFFVDTYLAYGAEDKKLKYDGLIEYSFNDRKAYRKEYPLNSIRFEYMYDINELGQDYVYATKDNMFLAWKRQNDSRVTYLRNAELSYYHELYNGLAYGASICNRLEYATKYAEFNRYEPDGTFSPMRRYDMSELELKVRYAKNEKFYQTRNIRYPITFDALILNASHVMAAKNFLGSSYNYQRTDIGMQKRFWFSAFGYLDVISKAGKVWSKVPYPLLILPNVNLSYTIQPEQLTNMNAMEFLSDQYYFWDVTYYLNGNLLNRLPLIKKLKWREVFSCRGMGGSLSDKNNPMISGADHTGLYQFPENSYTFANHPYVEAGVGIENIFRFLRLDYVWRMNYLDHPGIQKSGIRVSARINF